MSFSAFGIPILRNSSPQVFGLSDIDQFIGIVEKAIYTGKSGEGLQGILTESLIEFVSCAHQIKFSTVLGVVIQLLSILRGRLTVVIMRYFGYVPRMEKRWVLGVLALVMSQASSATEGVGNCDALYAKRGMDSLRAAQCYQQLSRDQSTYERMFVALSATVNDLPKSSAERAAIDLGLKLVKEYHQEFGSTAEYFYWKACFMSFDVLEKDRGAVIPTNMFGVLGELQDLLQKAIKLDPSVHFYGPMRVLGMMHTQMPMIVGGDKTLAEKLLREAYQKAPVFSMNHLAYARILEVNGKTTEAVKVIQKFLSADIESFNPYPDQPLRSLVPEALKEKKEAQKLLNDINE